MARKASKNAIENRGVKTTKICTVCGKENKTIKILPMNKLFKKVLKKEI